MWTWNAARYGANLAGLLTEVSEPELGPGTPVRSVTVQMRSLNVIDMFSDQRLVNPVMSDCCRAGLWLAFNFLDESHDLSQQIASPEGSYWHAIMHRREPDFENSKYWYRRVGTHAVYAPLLVAARSVPPPTSEALIRRVIGAGQWDAFAFVDLCRIAYRGDQELAVWCRRVAQLEWQYLFDACYFAAVGQEPSWSAGPSNEYVEEISS